MSGISTPKNQNAILVIFHKNNLSYHLSSRLRKITLAEFQTTSSVINGGQHQEMGSDYRHSWPNSLESAGHKSLSILKLMEIINKLFKFWPTELGAARMLANIQNERCKMRGAGSYKLDSVANVDDGGLQPAAAEDVGRTASAACVWRVKTVEITRKSAW